MPEATYPTAQNYLEFDTSGNQKPQALHLDQYNVGAYTPGATLLQQLLWYFLGDPLVRTILLPISGIKVFILRLFGARIGQGVCIKPGVKIKFPWRLTLGDHTWLGEQAWLDNVAPITVGSHVCISQGAYLCTGNHNWRDPHFALTAAPITIGDSAWIAANATVGPGVTVGAGAILGLGSVACRDLQPWMIYQGNPAQPIKPRTLTESPHA
jgi:putative colanic acid biosynthesis acetyltransferase WcaF